MPSRVHREACTVRTADQLDALPHLSLVIRPYTSPAGWKLHEVWERRNGLWYCLAAPLNPPGQAFGTPNLPALLIHHPDWEPQ